jgi:hypothetical protein
MIPFSPEISTKVLRSGDRCEISKQGLDRARTSAGHIDQGFPVRKSLIDMPRAGSSPIQTLFLNFSTMSGQKKRFLRKYFHKLRSRNDERVHDHVHEYFQRVTCVHDHDHEVTSNTTTSRQRGKSSDTKGH